MINAKTGQQCSEYGVMRTYLRDGSSPNVVKKRPFYMIDSTYTVASDPNTMRDTGFLRNAEYKVVDPADYEYLRRTTGNFHKTDKTIKEQLEDEKRWKATLDARCPHKRPASLSKSEAKMGSSDTSFSFVKSNLSLSKKSVRVIEPEP